MTHRPEALALALALAAILATASQAHATTYSVSLTGDPSQFTESQFNYLGSHYQQFDLSLTGLDSSNAITVSQGDEIDSTITLTAPYTIPTSSPTTYFLQYLTGSNFPNENTGSNGTITFYNGAVMVASYGYGSTTSSQITTLNAIFPLSSGPFTFDSITNDVTVTLATPATLDGSFVEYDLVTNAVPEPASWTMMLVGLGILGALTRRRAAGAAA